ncbi:CHAP domain-containing protein [Streptomyces sp. NBC_00079]|uniref:CHAP domain-containing protein n=1 Tax=Streptomyces sp. NBC_00079 TaxID=2975644 RepID=UPI00324BF857
MSDSAVGVSWWRRRCVAVVAAVVSGGVLAVVPVVPAGAVTAGGLGSAETLRSNASVRGSGTVNDRLRPGERLTAGQSLAPANGENQLVMQGDGNLVLLSLGHPVWGSGTEGHPGASATMQGDGNLVINDANGKALWGSGTDGHPGASATMQGDGNFVVNDTHGKALWASRTINNSLHPTSKLGSGQELRSVSEQYKLVMQGDGNLVEYNAGGKALWGSGTQGHPGASATMQGDGNLVINDANGKALWGSGTEGHPGAWINLQDDGNLVIYQNGKALWGNGANNPPPAKHIDDYPYANSVIDDLDGWGFFTRECTSFVAWRIRHDLGMSDFTNTWRGGLFGHAEHWAANARQIGVPVDGHPTVGSVAVFPPGVDGVGDLGHVAYVIGVGNGTVDIEDYNYMTPYNGYQLYKYSQHTVNSAGLSFIHFVN